MLRALLAVLLSVLSSIAAQAQKQAPDVAQARGKVVDLSLNGLQTDCKPS